MIEARRPSGILYDVDRVDRFWCLVPSNIWISIFTFSANRGSLYWLPYAPKLDSNVSHSVEHSKRLPYIKLRYTWRAVAYNNKIRDMKYIWPRTNIWYELYIDIMNGCSNDKPLFLSGYWIYSWLTSICVRVRAKASIWGVKSDDFPLPKMLYTSNLKKTVQRSVD